ncbi:DUF2927 domain-containing protein [Paroceanicella profunda]|uniref:DUF2927 domain-containing protein n=1 Tax=Paroceanicella profunda TaxID=2579971 RepID=A0A5B8FYV2_9RHOB|nr:DUF2927 domain-containing protein [Paroceanicella profunda]QDL92580.1 DUF2927 domain-containing protein [Paroceanicella profunda]
MRLRPFLLVGIAALALAGCARSVPYAPLAAPALPGLGMALTPGPVEEANRDIADDLVDLVFHPENGPDLDSLLRFEEPVRVALVGDGLEQFGPDLDRLIARMRAEAELDIARTDTREAANIRVTLAPKRQMLEVFPGAQCFILPGLFTWSEFAIALRRNTLPRWEDLTSLTGATIFIPSTSTPNEIRECFEEEIAQAMGPANDLFRLPETVFNDDNVYATLTRFDLLILRVLYDPSLHSGMSREETRAAALKVLDTVNPDGRRLPRRHSMAPEPDWTILINSLFEGGMSRDMKRYTLRAALKLAVDFPQPDHRLAYTLDLLASLEYPDRPALADGLLQRALESLEEHFPEGDLRTATIRLYLAQTRLTLDHPDEALALVDAALPVFSAYAIPLNISHALHVRAGALTALGRSDEAVTNAIDSVRWARYAQGADYSNLDALQQRLENMRPPGPPG